MWKGWIRQRWLSFWIVAVALTACTSPLDHDSSTPFRGTTVRIVVPFSVGGTYDLHARILARHLGRHLPGNPAVAVENMTGAGGMIAARHLATRVPPDGTTFGMLSPGVALAPFLDGPSLGLAMGQLGILGSPDVDIPVCIFSRSCGIDNVDSWRVVATPPRLGMTGPGALSHTFATLVTEALNLPMTSVTGYSGMAEIRHAIDGQEVDGACLGYSAFKGIFVPASDYVVAVQAGSNLAAGLERVDLVSEKVTTPEQHALADMLQLITAVGRYYAFPPNTPAQIVDLVGEAFDATMEDAAFRSAASEAQLGLNWRSRSEVRHSVEALDALSPRHQRLMTDTLSPGRLDR